MNYSENININYEHDSLLKKTDIASFTSTRQYLILLNQFLASILKTDGLMHFSESREECYGELFRCGCVSTMIEDSPISLIWSNHGCTRNMTNPGQSSLLIPT